MDTDLIEMIDHEALAMEGLFDYVHDEMSENDCRDYLAKIFEIVGGNEKPSEKYALISDIYWLIVNSNTQDLIGHV